MWLWGRDQSSSHGHDGTPESSNLHLEEMDLQSTFHLNLDLNEGYNGQIQRMHTAKANLSAVFSDALQLTTLISHPRARLQRSFTHEIAKAPCSISVSHLSNPLHLVDLFQPSQMGYDGYELNSFFEARVQVSTKDFWRLMYMTLKLKQHLSIRAG